MNILLVGDAAREHAIAGRVAEDAGVFALLSKKNPGIARCAKKIWICDTSTPTEVERCIKNEKFDLGFVSPDALLSVGITDALAKYMPVASPTKAAARIEWDKRFMRTLMEKHAIAGRVRHALVQNENEAAQALRDLGPSAIKPLGLTGGKGVRVHGDHFTTDAQAMEYVQSLLRNDGVALIEEKLEGEEFSLQAFSDGTRIAVMPPVQDHKRAFADDEGPNTGGMGSYSTGKLLPFLQPGDIEQATAILQQTVDAMRKEGTPFQGVLYGQFMAVRDGVRVVEFNARFGDPEAMNVLVLLADSLSDIFLSIADGNLGPVRFRTDATVVKYLVPNGYPENPVHDVPIRIDESLLAPTNVHAYYASVYAKEGAVYCTKSRAVALLGTGTLAEAEQNVERACAAVQGPLFHRADIGTASLVEKRVQHMHALREAE